MVITALTVGLPWGFAERAAQISCALFRAADLSASLSILVMTCKHEWSRAILGRRTGLWLQTCLRCFETSATKARPTELKLTRQAIADVDAPPMLDIRRRMEKFHRPEVASTVRHAILDARQRQSGERNG